VLVALKEEDKLQRRTFVESPIAGQPAEKAGVWAGDEIVKVDGKSTVDLPLDDVVAMIRGKSGTVVKLTVLREGVNGEIEIPVYRAPIKVTNVEGRLLEHHPCIAWVKLTGFIDTSFDELKAKILELDGECKEGGGLRGLVFDLRNNSGGLLTQGVRISDLFLETGRIVTVKNRRRAGGLFAFMEPQDEVYTAKKKGTLMVPMVVLVNDGSASAAEIVASALQDNGRALIVGERTFGKASVQTLINPMKGEGYYVKLTIARYYGPSGRTLQVVGVMPDVEVPPDPGATKMPLGFREEDLSNHLAELDHDYVSANRAVTDEIRPCVEKRGIAERIVKDDPRPQIRFDMQLFRGADYLECLIDEVQAHGGVMPGAPPVEEAPAVPTVPALPPPGAAL
jgi:C-terminal peptidase prc